MVGSNSVFKTPTSKCQPLFDHSFQISYKRGKWDSMVQFLKVRYFWGPIQKLYDIRSGQKLYVKILTYLWHILYFMCVGISTHLEQNCNFNLVPVDQIFLTATYFVDNLTRHILHFSSRRMLCIKVIYSNAILIFTHIFGKIQTYVGITKHILVFLVCGFFQIYVIISK